MVKEYNELTKYSEPHATNLMAQANDAVWTMALALNATESQLIESGTPTQDLYSNFDLIDSTS